MKICLMLQLLSYIPPHNTRYERICAPASAMYSQKMIPLGSRLIACRKLAPTLPIQMWLHNYVIDRNEYLIFTLSESVNPWVYSLQFSFKSTNNSRRYERKCESVFFFWTQCNFILMGCFERLRPSSGLTLEVTQGHRKENMIWSPINVQ